jgi:hypothetical protein
VKNHGIPAMQETESSEKKPMLWASCVRIFATGLIFLYHFKELHSLPWMDHLDKYGIALFLFISGYFSFQPRISPGAWILGRFKQILIPYWSVILAALMINRALGYKQTTVAKDIIVFFGGSLFLDDPVYVISWFITFILIMYLLVVILRSLEDVLLKGSFIGVCIVINHFYDLVHPLYVPAFFLGYFLRWLTRQYQYTTRKKNVLRDKVYWAVFSIQNHCYSFFLVHGGILLFTTVLLGLNERLSFATGLVLSTVVAFYHKMVSDIIISKLASLSLARYRSSA